MPEQIEALLWLQLESEKETQKSCCRCLMLRQLPHGGLHRKPNWKKQNSLLVIVFEYQTSIPRSRRATNENIATKFSKSPVCCDEKIPARILWLTVCKVLVAKKFRVDFTIKNWWRSDIIFLSIDPGIKHFIVCHFVLIHIRNKYL